MRNSRNERVVHYDAKTSGRDNLSDNDTNQINNPLPKKGKLKIFLVVLGVFLLVVAAGVCIYLFIIPKQNKDNNVDTEDSHPTNQSPGQGNQEEHPIVPVSNNNNDDRKLGSEFEFNTKVGDLKRISVNQKYKEDMLIDGEKLDSFLTRITNYDIYIVSEEEPDENNKLFYDKMYTCAISIQSECYGSTKDDCTPKKVVDLSSTARRNLDKTRKLQQVNDLKDIPIPICLFNLTNNDVITSISCHNKFSEEKKKMLLLDLYFFRPPGIKRLTKENMNDTITRRTEGNKKYIRETNGGICDIENAEYSFCTTDMNTTTDLENNILTYEEEAIMNITTDSKNSYIKKKNTKLVDITKNVGLNVKTYEQNLNKILNKLNPYFKNEVLFSNEDFNEVYIVNKYGMKALKKNQKRNLAEKANKMIKQENNLFNFFSPEIGINVDVALYNNIGINSDFMEANTKLYLEQKDPEYISTSKVSSRNLTLILRELTYLSEAGNHLATQLYQKTNISLENMTEEIDKAITILNDLIKYKDLSDIFDSTLSLDVIKELPFIIIQESNNLQQKLDELLTNIENGGIKPNIKILNKNIYDYISESHNIIYEIFCNLRELSSSLSSPKSKLTEISTYYLNHTSTSYATTIKKAQDILSNYYIDEFNLIKPKIDKIISNFEEKLTESLQKETKIIDNLYEKIENKNFTIKQANDEDLKTILNNLYYTKNFIKEVIEKIKEKVRKEMDIKPNGYFINEYDLNENKETYSQIINKASQISNQLDNDEFIDTKFDEVMRNIKRNYTSILKDMEKQKEELFPLNEDVLKESSFTNDMQNEMKDNITELGVNILNKIRRENNHYLKLKEDVVNKFLANNKDYLNKLTSELDTLFSTVKLEELANLYEKAFRSCLEKTKREIKSNELISNEYFNDLVGIHEDNNKLIKLLNNFHTDPQHLVYCLSRRRHHEVYLTSFADSITSKTKTEGYLIKYKSFKDSFEKSKLYINEQLYPELLSEYKKFLSKIREILQVFKNNKLSDIYPDFEELSFVDDNIRTIDNFYTRLNKHISDDIFNNKYIKLMNDYKISENSEITNINNFIESKHSIIDSKDTGNSFNYDFCLTFLRKKTYTCVNGVVSTYTNSDYYCVPLSTKSNNHLKLVEHSIYSDSNLLQFHSAFDEFYEILSKKVLLYTSKIKELKESLSNIEIETINEGITSDYLTPINNTINSLLSNKHGEEIIKSAYNYYQPNIKTRIEPLLDDISSQWNTFFDNLKIDIENNLNNFKNSITEFPNFANFLISVLSSKITNNYFDSITLHQMTEFNYTISYYYNLLIRNVKSSYQYVISKIPTNKIGFNNIVDKRKNEINDFFNNLIKSINDSLNKSLNLTQQTKVVLHVAETNFFEINDILKNNVLSTQKSLKEKIEKIKELKNNKYNDEFSLAARYYLENSESGKQIEQLYEQIDQKVFVYLNLDKFKELLIENWIFDQDEFIKSLNTTLYNSNLEIEKEFKTEKEKYLKIFEEEITKYYTEDEITKRINDFYKNEVKELKEDQMADIKKNIDEILEKIKQHFKEEAKRLKGTMVSYNKDYSKIEERVKNYQDTINQKVKDTIFSAINDFYSNMNNQVYTKYYEKNLNDYENKSEEATSPYEEISLFSSKYNAGKIVLDIIKYLTKKYKQYIKLRINTDYEEYYLKMEKNVDIKGISAYILENITEAYNTILLPELKNVATYDTGITEYKIYDLNETILNDIDSTINNKIDSIKNIIDSTKGSDFNIDLNNWEIFDFSRVFSIIKQNCDKLLVFLQSQKENEKEIIDLFLKNIILSNFNDLLENIIPSFGNQFFERIIKYNENFKISSLYNNLKYSLSPTVAYYRSIGTKNIKALTKDLKLKIYSLNDLDLVAKEKNKEVLELLSKKVNEFIENSKEFLIGKYIAFFVNDVSVETSFKGEMHNEIIEITYSLEKDFNKRYTDLMDKYLKDKLISSYTKVMNEQTADMVLNVEEKRETLKSILDDLFSLEPDSVLNDINNKINNTLRSIEKFKAHFTTFEVSNNLVDYLNNYGKYNIQPKFDGILDILNKETKNKITDTVGKNSKDYINYFNDKEFVEKLNNTFINIDKKYIKNINESIEEYGKENYPNNLEIEIDRQTKRYLRRLERLLTEEEIENEHKEKIADKTIDDTFSKLLTSSNNTKRFINSFEKFSDFDSIINENINKLNTAYKYSLKRIKDNNYVEETYNNLTSILSQLKQTTLDYYKNINNSFYILKSHLKNSIENIDDNLNKCANITYTTFAEKYENISIDSSINSTSDKIKANVQDSLIVENQGKITTVNYTASNILEKAKFFFDYNYNKEGDIKKPKLKASVINQSKPEKIYFKFINKKPFEGDIIERVEVEPNNVNFTINLNYNTSTHNLIYVTTIVDFESYKYSREKIQMVEQIKYTSFIIDDIVYEDFEIVYTEDNPKVLSSKKEKTIEKQSIIDESVVNKDILFN